MSNKVSNAAAVLGRIKTEKKAASSRENGKLGGRPRTVMSEDLDSFGLPKEVIIEMANLGPRLTGLPKVIHIWSQGHSKIKHGPRVKVSLHSNRFDEKENVSVSISDDPEIVSPGFKFGPALTKKEFEIIRAWILKKKDKLLKYWNSSSTTVDEILED